MSILNRVRQVRQVRQVRYVPVKSSVQIEHDMLEWVNQCYIIEKSGDYLVDACANGECRWGLKENAIKFTSRKACEVFNDIAEGVVKLV